MRTTAQTSPLRAVADRNIPGLPAALAALAQALGRALELAVLPAAAIDAAAVRQAELLFVRSTVRVGPALLLGSAVRLVATATIGTDHLDLPWLAAQGIHAASAPGCNADSVVQWLAAALLSHALPLLQRARAGEAPVAGVVGVGNVGRRAARLLEALGFQVLRCDPPRQRSEAACADFLPLDALLGRCDLLTLHVPLTRAPQDPDATFGLLDAARVQALRPGVVLVNACRGEVLGERGQPVLQAARAGCFAALLLDVFPGEPRPDPALVAAATVATAHIAGHSLEGKINGTRMVYEAACRHLGVTPTWQPGPEWLPPPPLDGVCVDDLGALDGDGAVDDHPDDLALLQALVQRSYDLAADDHALRQIVALPEPPEDRAGAYRRFRDQYPVRRELTGARLRALRPRPWLAGVLAALGVELCWV